MILVTELLAKVIGKLSGRCEYNVVMRKVSEQCVGSRHILNNRPSVLFWPQLLAVWPLSIPAILHLFS